MIVTKKLTIHGVILALAGWALLGHAHQGSHDDTPIVACKEKKLTNLCEYNNHAGDIYRGTCRSFSGTLMCVRNKPIIKAKKSEIKEDTKETAATAESTDVSPKYKVTRKAVPKEITSKAVDTSNSD